MAVDVGKVVEVKVKVVFDAVVGKMVDVAGVLWIIAGDGFVVSLIIVVAVVIIDIGAEVGYRELMVAIGVVDVVSLITMEGVFVLVTIDVVVPVVELE